MERKTRPGASQGAAVPQETLTKIRLLLGLRQTCEVRLEKAVEERLAQNRMGPVSYLKFLEGNVFEQNLLKQLTAVDKTYFFRPSEHFVFFKKALSEKLEQKGKVQVWSAACSTGPAPYSAGIVASSISPAAFQKTIIFASDISDTSLATARNGGPYAQKFHFDTKDVEVAKLFSFATKNGLLVHNKEQDLVSASEILRNSIRFLSHDLTASPFPAGFDFIFCCNVLLYYKREVQKVVVSKLFGSLTKGGYLFVGNDDLRTLGETLGDRAHKRISSTIIQKP